MIGNRPNLRSAVTSVGESDARVVSATGYPLRWRWLAVPAMTILLGASITIWSIGEERNLKRGFAGVLRAHADLIVRLVQAAVQQTTNAMDAVTTTREAQLRALAQLSQEWRATQEATLVAEFDEKQGGQLVARSGRVEPSDRKLLEKALARADDSVELAAGGIACLIDGVVPTRKVRCWDDHEVQSLRRSVGLGALLRQVTHGRRAYISIQDKDGLLASSPTQWPLSSWSEDPDLELARVNGLRFRDAPGNPNSLIEALTPYILPDGTVALLRIGIDAEPVRSTLGSATRRHHALLAIIGVLVTASLVFGLALRRHDRRMEDYQRRFEAQERQRLHWQQVGMLAAEVAHEIRNPLNTVKMVGQRLLREFQVSSSDRAEYEELVNILGSEGERIETVVKGFLDLSRPLQLNLQSVDLEKLLGEIVSPLGLRAENENKKIVMEIPAGLQANLDPKKFFQIVTNLAANSLDAIDSGGLVKISAHARAKNHDHGIEVAVSDNGAGMSAKRLEQVGHPFQTSKAKGIGLGLVLVRRLVEAHGGSLAIDSIENQGTRVTLWFPRNDQRPEV